MKRWLFMLVLTCTSQAIFAQYVYTIKADSVKITNSCDTAELIIENHTQDVCGFLFNKGKGRTEFRRAVVKINDSTYLIGCDTLRMYSTAFNGLSVSNGKAVFGQDVGQANNPAALLSNRQIPMNNYDINFNGGHLLLSGAGSVNYPLLQFEDNSRGIWSQGGGQITLKAGGSFLTVRSAGETHTGVDISDVPAATPSARLSVKQVTPITDTGSHHMLDITGIFSPSSLVGSFNCVGMYPTINQSGSASGITRGIYIQPTISAATDFRAIEVTSGKSILNGKVTINSSATPTAGLLLGAGTATAGTAPLKLAAGTVLSTPENGAVEFDGSDLYFTENATRYKLSKTLAGQLTTNFGSSSLSAFNSVTTTLTVSGVQAGDVVNVSANTGAVNPPSIIVTAYVTSNNTVTLQAYNASNSAVTIASDTYKVRVIK